MPRRVRTGSRLPQPPLPAAETLRHALAAAVQALELSARVTRRLLEELRDRRGHPRSHTADRPAEEGKGRAAPAAAPDSPAEIPLPDFVGMMHSGRGDLSTQVKRIVRGTTSE